MSIFNTVPPLAAGRGLTFDGETMSLQVPQGAGAHNAIYRGKALGSAVTDAQWAAIAAGTFDDLYIGDYWTIGGVNWRIAAFDYYLNSGDSRCSTHHILMVPDECLYSAQMNNTSSGQWEDGSANTTASGYIGTDMYKKNLASAESTIKAAFSGHVLNHRNRFTNAASNGIASASAWVDSYVSLMTERMVYGNGVFNAAPNGSTTPSNHAIDIVQIPLFRHDASSIRNGSTWWLRDIVDDKSFSFVGDHGTSDYSNASDSRGVRPAFSIC